MSATLNSGIRIKESYVLSINIRPFSVEFDMDFMLSSEHPRFAPALSGEQGCFRRGCIEVRNFSRVLWNATGFLPATDASGETDYGCMDEIVETEEGLTFIGDWGHVSVDGGEICIRLSDAENVA